MTDPAGPETSIMFGGKRFGAFLFDMDGTLLTSIEASQRVWGRWAARFGLDASMFLPRSHGMRVAEVIESLALPGVDAAAEAETILREELNDMAGVRRVPGAAAFLLSIPQAQWAVVTSAPRQLALRRMAVAGLPSPPALITAEDIERGKPDPACYRLAARHLGLQPDACLVFEDASAGVAAGIRAGASVLVISAAHQHSTATGHPYVRDFTCIVPVEEGSMLTLHRRSATDAASERPEAYGISDSEENR